ncbi:MAG: sulfatase, partial [bacterium]
IRNDLIEHIDMAAISLAAAGIAIPEKMQAKNNMSPESKPRDAVFAARDRCDETVERIRSVRTADYLYIRNFYPSRPHLQPNAYKDNKSIVISIRALHDAGKLSPLAEKLLFAPTRPPEELYLWQTDRFQVNNLAADPAHSEALKSLRARLGKWMTETADRGPESEKMYDSDMAVYVGNGDPQVEANIRQMKQWAKQGK